tara:strand:+ start:188 stop:463 length:276 start_codon:yes stop_codon:yes gene_type:complete
LDGISDFFGDVKNGQHNIVSDRSCCFFFFKSEVFEKEKNVTPTPNQSICDYGTASLPKTAKIASGNERIQFSNTLWYGGSPSRTRTTQEAS